MSYSTPQALRTALEQRLATQSARTQVPLDRLRRRVIFERIVTRLQRVEPGRWVLKGGMALEVRLGDAARLTKDIDLGLRESSVGATDLRERLIDVLGTDRDRDGFTFSVSPAKRMATDGGGHATWRLSITAVLAGRQFGAVKLDISPRVHELDATTTVELATALHFAGMESVEIEIIGVDRHAAEKFHAMLKDFGDRENTRVRDLVDLMLLREHGLLSSADLGASVAAVWMERDGTPPPSSFPGLPTNWERPYETLATEHGITPADFPTASAVAAALWAELSFAGHG